MQASFPIQLSASPAEFVLKRIPKYLMQPWRLYDTRRRRARSLLKTISVDDWTRDELIA
jgi:hypothetical protein